MTFCLGPIVFAQQPELGPIVRVDQNHWRVFAHAEPNSKLQPTLIVNLKPRKMSAIRLKDGAWWEATVEAKGDLTYAVQFDSDHRSADQTVRAADYPLPKNPAWSQASTLYRIEIDRFDRAGGPPKHARPGFEGGNLQGILGHLDAVASLGVGALILSPLVPAKDPFHREVTDPSILDPELGDPKDFADVVTQVHQRDLRILAEGPRPGGIPSLDGWLGASSPGGWNIAPTPTGKADTAEFDEWFDRVAAWVRDPDQTATELDAQLKLQRDQLPDELIQHAIHALGNADAARPNNLFADPARQRQAWVFLFTYPGIPLLRAGDEIGLSGGPFPDNRAKMPWNPGREDAPLQRFITALIGLRAKRPSLARGSFETIVANNEKGLFGYFRQDRFEGTLVLFNNGTIAQTYTAAAGRFGGQLVDLLGTSSIGVVNGVLTVNVAPHGYAVIGTP
jgi:hypothetical protein